MEMLCSEMSLYTLELPALSDIPRVLSTAISALGVDFITSYSDGVVRIQSPGANPVTSEQLCPDELHTARPNVSADRMYAGTAGVLPHRSRLYNLVPVPQSRKHPQGKLFFSIVANASGLSFSNRLIARVKVYGYLLTEKKLVLCAVNYSILTPVTETLRALLHPFECQLVYIPVLPLVRDLLGFDLLVMHQPFNLEYPRAAASRCLTLCQHQSRFSWGCAPTLALTVSPQKV